MLVRTLPSGRPDNAFNRANWTSNRSLAFDRERIVVAGDYGRHEVFALARNKPDGHVDHSFDKDEATTDFGDPHASANWVTVGTSRRPVAVG